MGSAARRLKYRPTYRQTYTSLHAMRNRLYDWFQDVLMTRIEPGGSVIVNMARWHTDDFIARLACAFAAKSFADYAVAVVM